MKGYLIIFSICMTATFFSCRKDRADNGSGSAYIKMEIGSDARKWEAGKGVAIGTSFIDGKHNFTIAGVDQDFGGEASGLSIVFSQTGEIGVGNYTLSSSSDGGGSITKVNGKTYMVGSGASGVGLAIEITEVSGNGTSRKFKGRFQGQLVGPAPGDNIGVTGEFSSL